MERDGVNGRAEGFQHGVHHGAVEGVAGTELAGRVSGGFERQGEGLDGFGGSGDDAETRGIERGNVQRGRQQGQESGLRQADRQHGAGGHVGHEAAPQRDQFGGVFEGHDTGEGGGNVFPDAVAQHGRWCQTEGEEQLAEGVFDREKRGLGETGIVEIRDVMEIEVRFGKTNGAGVEGIAVSGFVGVEFLAHARVL